MSRLPSRNRIAALVIASVAALLATAPLGCANCDHGSWGPKYGWQCHKRSSPGGSGGHRW